MCTFTPLYGRLCDLLGRRRANQLAVCTTALGTISCAFSRDMKTLVAARFVSSTSLGKTRFPYHERGVAGGDGWRRGIHHFIVSSFSIFDGHEHEQTPRSLGSSLVICTTCGFVYHPSSVLGHVVERTFSLGDWYKGFLTCLPAFVMFFFVPDFVLTSALARHGTRWSIGWSYKRFVSTKPL